MAEITRCPKCPDGDSSGDNLRIKDNGFAKCFACGYTVKNYYGKSVNMIKDSPIINTIEPLHGEYKDLKKRKIPKAWLQKWGVLYLKDYLGEPALAFPYYKETSLSGYHIKPISKKCKAIGNPIDSDMFGSKSHGDPTNKLLIITEGHEDCIVACGVCGDAGRNYTTLKNGIGSVDKFIKQHYEELSRYKGIVLCFDNDKPGEEGVQKFIKEFNQVGKVSIVKLPLKDANDMLIAGRENELKWAIFNAEVFRPKTAVSVKDIIKKALTPPQKHWDWVYPTMNLITGGGRLGEIHIVAAAPGIGKTEFLEKIYKYHLKQGKYVGLISLEQSPEKSLQRLAGSDLHKRIHLSTTEDAWEDTKEIEEAMLCYDNKIEFFDKRNGADLNNIIQTIYYWVNAKGISLIILDNLKALATKRLIDGKRAGEFEYLSYVGERLYELVMTLPVTIIVASHLTKDTMTKNVYVSTSPKNKEEYTQMDAGDTNKMVNKPGLTWAAGRMGSPEHVFGANTLEAFCSYLWILARNKESEDDIEHRTLVVKCGKAREDSRYENKQFSLLYDYNDGSYTEVDS